MALMGFGRPFDHFSRKKFKKNSTFHDLATTKKLFTQEVTFLFEAIMFTKSLIPFLALTALVLTSPVQAESGASKANRTNYDLPRIDSQPDLDGKLDEAVWQNAVEIELKYENNPGEGVPAPVKTLAYLYEDGEHLYVAIKAFDPDPSKIRAYLRDRDTLWQDDNVGIIIDTFNDERSGFEFFVNPLGAQADMSMTDTNGWNEDSSWDAIWDSAGAINDEGFVVEMAIPFRVLRFPQGGEELTWNLAVWRNYPRDTRHQMSNYVPDRNSQCNLCLFDRVVGFKDIKPGKNFQLTPTMTSSRSDNRDDQGADWDGGSFDVEGGLDLRWGITQDMVLNATINPDFSQVEADSAQLDINNTFSLFFPEKRPFFLDGASYFKTQRFNLLHTRNIADPDYGAKVTGKSDEHSYGVMVANDNETTFLLPGSQGSDIHQMVEERNGKEVDLGSDVAIARYKVDIGERNNLGAMVTTRSGEEYTNTVASVDGSYWLSKEDNINYQFAYSDTDNPLELQDQVDEDGVVTEEGLDPEQSDHAMSLGYRHSTRDYSISATYNNIGEDFRSDLGFMSQVNYEKLIIGGSQTWYGDDDDMLNRWGYSGDWDKTYDQSGQLLEEEAEIHANISGPMQLHANAGIVHRDKFYDDKMFNEVYGRFWFGLNPASGVRIQGWGTYGDAIDYANSQLGTTTRLGTYFSWQMGAHIQLSGELSSNQMDVDDGQLFHAKQSDLRLTYQFDMRSYIRLVVQYTDITRNPGLYDSEDDVDARSKYMNTQLLYSYKINPQTLFFLGYSDKGRQEGDFSKLVRTDRTVFAKFSYAWQM